MFKEIVSQAVPFIDHWLQFRYARLEMPGFVVAISIDGKVEFLKAYGYADAEKGEPMTTDHVFRIASHSKTFAATAIMQLAEERLLHIDEPVAKYVPWLRDHKDHRMEKVTIRQLMSHSAGMIRDGKDANFWQLTNSFHDLADFKKALMSCDLVFDTNKQMKYSNFGYALLGCVVEEVYGMPFSSYVQAKILQPLGLSHTTSEVNDDMHSKLVVGYTRRGREKKRQAIEKHIDTRQMAAATGFCSTAADLCKYFEAHFVGSKKLLNDESKKEMQRTQWRVKNTHIGEEYGLGFQIESVLDRKVYGHGGAFPGQRTKTICDSNEKLIIVVLTNCIDGEASYMARGLYTVLDHFHGSAYRADRETIDQLRKFEGIYTSLWGDLAIVESGRNLIGVDPNTWFPFGRDQEIQVLELAGDNRLRIANANGYYSEGEYAEFDFDFNGNVISVDYAGYNMLPESEYSHDFAKTKVTT
ncbi:MAG TPA: class A beta-lactamase-related serine hydrolase [Candidatus Melainabacteria bacterium]|nr:class A beta-lactamase-related serine hydrolase [Candidatus Melainabacteria bacterium]HIN66264.1 class A beta-lactamase-related serine hydrolase [Candidatus Obscuribacterales bacterium]